MGTAPKGQTENLFDQVQQDIVSALQWDSELRPELEASLQLGREASRPEHSTGGIAFNPFPRAEVVKEDTVMRNEATTAESLLPTLKPSEILREILVTTWRLSFHEYSPVLYSSHFVPLATKVLAMCQDLEVGNANAETVRIADCFLGGEIHNEKGEFIGTEPGLFELLSKLIQAGELQVQKISVQNAELWKVLEKSPWLKELYTGNLDILINTLQADLTSNDYGTPKTGIARLQERVVQYMGNPHGMNESLIGREIWNMTEESPTNVPPVYHMAKLLCLINTLSRKVSPIIEESLQLISEEPHPNSGSLDNESETIKSNTPPQSIRGTVTFVREQDISGRKDQRNDQIRQQHTLASENKFVKETLQERTLSMR